MAFLAIHEGELFSQHMKKMFNGTASAYAEVRGWLDPRPEFIISFRLGPTFRGHVKHEVINQAQVYYRATQRLLGESP